MIRWPRGGWPADGMTIFRIVRMPHGVSEHALDERGRFYRADFLNRWKWPVVYRYEGV